MNSWEEKEYYIAYFDILGYKDFFTYASKKQMHDMVSMIYDGISGIKNYLNRFSNFSFMSISENIEVKFIGFSDKELCKNKFTLSSIDNYLLGLIT